MNRLTLLWDYEDGDTPAKISSIRKVPLEDVLAVLREVDPAVTAESVHPDFAAKENRYRYLLELPGAEILTEVAADEIKAIWKDPDAHTLKVKIRAAIKHQ